MNLLEQIKQLAAVCRIDAKFEQLFVNNADAVQVILPNKRPPDFQVMTALTPSGATAWETGLGIFTIYRPFKKLQNE